MSQYSIQQHNSSVITAGRLGNCNSIPGNGMAIYISKNFADFL
jgi:hypothetical protein